MAPTRHLMTGPFEHLEEALASAVAALRAQDCLASIYVLVPTHILGRHLMRAIARRQGICFNVRFHTFPDLAEIVGIEPLVRTGRLPQPPLADYLLARRALRQAVPADGYLAPVRDLPSTPRVVLRTLQDLGRAGLTPAQVAGLAAADGGRDGDAAHVPDSVAVPARDGTGASARKLRELARIYTTYQRLQVEAGYVDEHERLLLAAEAARTSPLLDRALAVCLYGFAELNRVEERFLEACLAGRPGYAFVPEDVAGHTRPLLEWLAGQGFTRAEGGGAVAQAGPRALAARLFAEPADAPGGDPVPGDVEIVSAPGVAAEVEALARRILAFAARGGRFHDVAVLLRHPEAYARAIRDVFRAAGIPYVVLDGVPAADHLAGRLLRLLLRIRLQDAPRPEVMEFLGLAPLRRALLGEAPEASPADWDRMSREAGVVRGRDQWRRLAAMRGRLAWRLERLRAEGADANGEEAALVARLEADLRSLRGFERTLRTLLKRLEALPDRGPLRVLMGRLLRALVTLAELPAEERAVVKMLADLVRGSQGEEEVSVEAFAALVDEALSTRVPATEVYRTGKVMVASPAAALGLPFRLVLIPGLVERSVPPPPRPDPLLLDHERAVLNRACGARLRLTEAQAADEQFTFRHAVGAAADALVLTYPRLDAATGQVRVPSHYLLRVAEALTGRPADYDDLAALTARIPVGRLDPGPVPLTLAEWDLRVAVRARQTGDLAPLAGLPGYPAIRRGVEAETARWVRRTLTPYDGVLGRPVPLPQTFAATQLETYATCPFRYFGERVLGVREIEEPEETETPTPIDRGALIHEILEAFLRGLAQDGLLPFRPGYLAEYTRRLHETARRAFRRFEREGAVGYAFMWQVEQRRILTDLETFLALELTDSSDFTPTLFEARFGPTPWGPPPPGSTPPPVEIPVGGRTLRLTGYIDRIDVDSRGGRARVIDYKTGRVHDLREDDRLEGGTALQLPLYIRAADVILGHRGIHARTVEAQYYHATGRGGFRRVRFTREALEGRAGDLTAILRTTVEGIAAGLFPQRPGKGGEHCRWCAFKPVCGQGRVTLAERKEGDPASLALRTMWEIR
ncbi:MAG: PD-(D/E)XK nuclease family protein [Armatimonadota bacterium]|nr:PD-(D/E)XK nuclease family protein [Armatimonadota bacterium]MDR7452755.1 PD-(D/E)XK nuclease family protein [Armatimonadota bacterium]MDR7505911.1 PD-(D/E)XK nuclease family protein [Armatimonadota bacterium]